MIVKSQQNRIELVTRPVGQQAKLGLTVGVLSGVGGVGDLIDADVIVNDITTMIDLILPEDPDQQVWSLTQFYSVAFSQSRISGKESLFTIKVCDS